MSVSPVRRSRKAAQKAVTKKRWIVSSSESEQEEQDVQDDESEVEMVAKTRKGARTSTRATANGTKKKTNGKVITIDSSDGEAEDDDVQMEDGQVDVDPSSERPGGLESEPEITGPIGRRPYILYVEIETSRASGSSGPVKRTSTPGSSKKKIDVSAFLIKKNAPKPAAKKDSTPSEHDDEEDEEPVKRGGRSSKSKPAPKTATKPSVSAQSKNKPKPKPKRKVTSDSDSDFKIESEHDDDDYAEPDDDEDHEVSSVEDLNDESEEEKPKKKSKSASTSTTAAASGLKDKPKSKSQSRAVSEEEEDDNVVDVESDAMSVVSEKKTVWKKKPAAKKSGKQPTIPVWSLSHHR